MLWSYRFHSYWTTCQHVVMPKYNQVVFCKAHKDGTTALCTLQSFPLLAHSYITHRPAPHKHIHNDWASGPHTTLTLSHSAVWKQPTPQFTQQASAPQNDSKAMLIVEHLAFPQHTFTLFSSAPSLRQSRSQSSQQTGNYTDATIHNPWAFDWK